MKKIVIVIIAFFGLSMRAEVSLDSSFGVDGRATFDFDSVAQIAVTFQPDGKIVAAGGTTASNDFALVRYNADGSLDSSFGTGGLVTTSFGASSDDRVRAVILQPDGKIVAAGTADAAGNIDFALARYNADGSLDSSFGTGGLVTTSFGGTDDRALAAVLQPDGKIVAAGRTNVSSDPDFALVRYNTDGSLDSSFGTGGLVTTQFTTNNDDFATSIFLQSDGKIVAVGRSNAPGNLDFALARYNADGSLDSSFGTDGTVTTDFGGGTDQARAVVLQPDGKIVAVGSATISGNVDFALARYNSDGSLDSSFDTGGLFTTSFGGSNNPGLSAVIQANGKVVAAGISDASGSNNFALARYLIPSISISQLAQDLRAKYFLLQ